MASVKEYGYYMEGSKISLVEKEAAFDNDPNSKDYGPGTDRFQYKSPLSDVTGGLEILYSYGYISNLDDESAEIDLPNYLSIALVDYVKAKYLEDGGQFKEAEYFMNKFRKQVEKYNNRIVSGPRIVAPGPFGIR
jgi:hypothetical protein